MRGDVTLPKRCGKMAIDAMSRLSYNMGLRDCYAYAEQAVGSIMQCTSPHTEKVQGIRTPARAGIGRQAKRHQKARRGSGGSAQPPARSSCAVAHRPFPAMINASMRERYQVTSVGICVGEQAAENGGQCRPRQCRPPGAARARVGVRWLWRQVSGECAAPCGSCCTAYVGTRAIDVRHVPLLS